MRASKLLATRSSIVRTLVAVFSSSVQFPALLHFPTLVASRKDDFLFFKMTVLAELRVSDPNGAVSFKLVVSLNMTMFNLHRVLQFCIKPRQSDSVIDCKVRSTATSTERS
jgi:hypothetical protein